MSPPVPVKENGAAVLLILVCEQQFDGLFRLMNGILSYANFLMFSFSLTGLSLF